MQKMWGSKPKNIMCQAGTKFQSQFYYIQNFALSKGKTQIWIWPKHIYFLGIVMSSQSILSHRIYEIGLKISENCRGVYSWIFPPPWKGKIFQNYFPGRGNQRDVESQLPLLGIYYIHIVTKIVKIPKYLLLFLCIFQILASLHIICIPSPLVFKVPNLGMKYGEENERK